MLPQKARIATSELLKGYQYLFRDNWFPQDPWRIEDEPDKYKDEFSLGVTPFSRNGFCGLNEVNFTMQCDG